MPEGGEAKRGNRQRRGSGRVTMREVAARAGVGAITVSRALANPAAVSSALYKRIEAAVAELGYVRNRIAGCLASAQSPVVPILVPSLVNAVYVDIIKGAHDALACHGYQVLLGTTDFSPVTEEQLVRTFLGWSPVGMILVGVDHSLGTGATLRSAALPVVEAMDLTPEPLDLNVGFSHLAVGRTMAAHFHAVGYRRMAFVGARLGQDLRAGRRRDGFVAGLAELGIGDVPCLDLKQFSGFGQGREALDWLLGLRPPVEAVFLAGDVLAVGLVLECQRRGVTVPDRLAVAGFNDQDVAAAINPGLTTIRSPRFQMGRVAAEMILRRVVGETLACSSLDLGFALVERGSTRSLAPARIADPAVGAGGRGPRS